ncbi:uncharacterized protein MONOS_14189 [Monocercomonoides exilis]|uniref:uncharacterized protein n=1 Tax=Monocercomonoides exilis TaxID=2049356 RepID=UPI00355A28F0|nr:hypothetical protein MONOS_14189 [Monocercomonoides exilis]|eukprot:MONOS_14189.1-p1 / transcript=MONOS_14189.1 / gene=MONOS_14189 / organism=Monocercomonoides_exilis_PA203 / gene_product=unspecified product / transcript_product=unspecified product / location=Mono_scaffold00952:14132-14536(+) / protein_length=135 / sequence_SO=supercontig / SO=protein_coding / is_pseudo=false
MLLRYYESLCAVLYGGVMCAHDVVLLVILSVPFVGQDPSLAAFVDTKSGRKRTFDAADVNAFPSIYDLFDPSLLPLAIARLVLRSQQSRRVVEKLKSREAKKKKKKREGKKKKKKSGKDFKKRKFKRADDWRRK